MSSAASPPSAPGPSCPSPCILVIEDDGDIRELISARLTRLGYPVQTAGTGEDGLVAAVACPPSLVLLDIGLPGVDGWEVARRLGAEQATAKVPIVVVSMLESDDRELGERIQGHVVKPFRGRDIEEVVRRIVGDLDGPETKEGH